MEELSATEMLAEVGVPSPQESAPSTPAPEQAGPWWQEKLKDSLEYTAEGGKKVNEPLEMVLKRAGMGYHYAQKMNSLNTQLEHYKGLEERNKSLSRWEEYDKYAQSNPEWAKHVEDGWNNRQNMGQFNQQANPEIAALRQQLSELTKFRDEFVNKENQVKIANEDKQMAGEIETVAKTYGVDLSQADEQGRTLEWRVLEQMEKLGLDKVAYTPGQFTAVFKDYYFDNLMASRIEKAKEQQVKGEAERKGAGILDISRTPKGKNPSNGYRPGASWNELGQEALNYLRNNK